MEAAGASSAAPQLTAGAPEPAPYNEEAAALVHIRTGFTNGDTVLPDWNTTAASPCGWTGVECNNSGVVALRIDNKGLEGTIQPGGWANLTHLQVADLFSNDLSGTIPATWVLPAAFRQLAAYGNRLQGSIPSSWRLPNATTTLWLYQNQLTGSLDPGWALPPSLIDLQLGQNQLNGSLTAAWQLPPGLCWLHLGDNRLTGTLPQDWAIPQTLERVILSNNSFEGPLPLHWPLPPSLQVLYLWGNNFSGSLPPNGNLAQTNLTELSLRNNQLTGSVPSSWQLPATLKLLRLNNNNFSGSYPVDLALPSGLEEFNLANNTLVGQVAPGANMPPGPFELHLEGNALAGKGWQCWLPGWPLPTWNNMSQAAVFIQPGNPGLCGTVPPTPRYTEAREGQTRQDLWQVGHLPACGTTTQLGSQGPSTASGGGGASAGAIAGAVVGAVAALGLCLAAFVVWRRAVRRRKALAEDKGGNGSRLESSEDALSRDPILSTIVSKLGAASSGGTTNTTSSSSTQRVLGPLEQGDPLLQWVIEFKDLHLLRKIGEGGFGQVYVGKWRETSVAVKLLLGPAAELLSSPGALDQALSLSSPVLGNLEAAVMSTLRHPNILGFLGLCLLPPCLVSEFCPRGSLYDILREARTSHKLASQLTWARRLSIAVQTAQGMHYLHSHRPPLLHRDLKSPNLLLDGHWVAKVHEHQSSVGKVGDFNLSRIMEPDAVASSTAIMNPRQATGTRQQAGWLAPEVLAGSSHSFASDVYSFGVVLWEMMTWEAPFTTAQFSSPWQVAQFVAGGGRLAVPGPSQLPGEHESEAFQGLPTYVALMHKCWAQDPVERPSFADIIPELRTLSQMVARGASTGKTSGPASRTLSKEGDSPSSTGGSIIPCMMPVAGPGGVPPQADGSGGGSAG
ncbi:hypothetical protein N2152v2_007821 [Parachlorella kessleri]